MNNTINECEIIYSEQGLRISHKCAICGKEMFPCFVKKVYCSRSCRNVGIYNRENNTNFKTMEQLIEHRKMYHKNYRGRIENKEVMQFRTDGSFVHKYKSVNMTKHFGNGLGNYCKNSVARCARGERNSYRGYIWIYVEDFSQAELQRRMSLIKTRFDSIKKPIVCLDMSGNYINRFDSIIEGSKASFVDRTSLLSHLKGKQGYSTCVGHLWMYEEDYLQQIQGA